MSEVSSRRSGSSVTEPLGPTAELGAQIQPKVKPVQSWAVIGGALLALQVYVWIRWLTGPYFQRVPAGPTELPALMRTILTVYTAGIVLGLPIGIWWFLIRPWRRERRITLDGMLLLSAH